MLDDFNYQYYGGSNRLKEVKPVLRDTVYSAGPIQTNHKVYRNITLQGGAYAPVGSPVRLNAAQNIFVSPDFRAASGADFYAHVLDDTEGTFLYDGVGNLVADQDQGIRISWTPSGKIREIRSQVDSTVISYRYDAASKRVEKKVVKDNQTSLTRYVLDAGGNVMAVYRDTTAVEQYLYGSARLGSFKRGVRQGVRTLGARQYELSNHLGNVLAVITDRVGMRTDSTWAQVTSSCDYYPFGLTMKGRNYNDDVYRYGFQGQEKVDEFNSNYAFEYRIHDPRLGRFLSIDPLFASFPWNSPYAFSENRVISAIELEGLEAVDLNTGQIDNSLSGQNLQTIQSTKNTSPWKDMANFSAPTSQYVTANLRGNSVTPQPMSRASGDQMSYDYYSVTINQLPTNMSMEDVFNHIKINFADFKKGATTTEKFGPSKASEQIQWSSDNPLTSIMRFVVNPDLCCDMDMIREGMAVMATNYTINKNSMSWVFTPVHSDQNGDYGHPLAGHRQFGITNNGNGAYTFFTRGIDTPYGFLDNRSSADIFAGAHQLWTNVMNNVSNYINTKGGSSRINRPVTFRKQR